MILLIIGLPGSGKTTLAESIVNRTNAIHLNADAVRADLNSDLGFSNEDRIEQSRRMGALARLLDDQGFNVVVDFVCPTSETRKAFGRANYITWVHRIESSRFADTNSIWQDPTAYDLKINYGLTPEQEADAVIRHSGLFDWRRPTTLMLGRYQPWHEGHHALYQEGFNRTDQVLIGVRDTYLTSEKDPLTFDQVSQLIYEQEDEAFVLKLPNITNIIYGRDVGYSIEQVHLSEDLQKISATQKRKELGI